MSGYNLTIVIDGKTTPAKRKAAVESFEKLISSLKGTVKKVEEIGEKELAYTIKKADKGYFLNFKLDLESIKTKDLLSKLQLDDNLLRYLLTKEEGKVKKGKANGKKS